MEVRKKGQRPWGEGTEGANAGFRNEDTKREKETEFFNPSEHERVICCGITL